MAVREVEFGESHRLLIREQTRLGDEQEAFAGAVVWDAALVLSQYLYLRSNEAAGSTGKVLAGRRVIEIGAGVGLVGLTAALLGAHVVLTDLPAVLPGLRHNIKENSLEDQAEVAELEWGTDTAHLQPPFDLVLASDVAYNSEVIPQLLATLAVLAGPHGHVLFAYEDRPPVTDAALRLMPSFGLIAKEVPATDLHPHWQHPAIHILDITVQPTEFTLSRARTPATRI